MQKSTIHWFGIELVRPVLFKEQVIILFVESHDFPDYGGLTAGPHLLLLHDFLILFIFHKVIKSGSIFSFLIGNF